MRIVRIDTFRRGDLCFVRVTAEDGAQGWGQIAPFDVDISETVLYRKVAHLALGRDENDLDGLSNACMDHNYKFPGSFVCRALGGIDTALWDLRGKRADCSVAAWIGAARPKVAAYASSVRRDITPEDEARRLRKLCDERGFKAVKVRIGRKLGHDQDQWPGRTDAIVPTVRRAVGDECRLMVDANSCYTPHRAIEVGRFLEQHGVCHFEEPCPYWELEWTAEVAAALDVPVTGGEQDVDLAQFRRMLGMRAVDVVQPDICYVGGITRALRVAAMAAELGIPVTPHSANRSMVTIFALHLMAAVPNAGACMEYSIEANGWLDGVFDSYPEVEDGQVTVPTEPGWGVSVRPDWLDKAENRTAHWENNNKPDGNVTIQGRANAS